VGIRTGPQALLEELAQWASVTVFNMLTSEHHPCQPLADLLTVREAFGAQALSGGGALAREGAPSSRLKLAYVGDGNNMARSLAVLGTLAGLDVAVASPPGYALALDSVPLSAQASGRVSLHEDPREAVAGAHVLYTDVWLSMGDEDTAEERRALLAPYRIDEELLSRADAGAIVLHCLPAHPGEEIAYEVLYGERQRIWDQAENRRHAQKALLELLLGDA
jgi:ornithine carbamoyltransferase